MMKTIISCVVFVGLSVLIAPKEFWLLPSKFIYATGENLIVNFNEGENFIGERWITVEDIPVNAKRTRLEKVEVFHQKTVTNVREYVLEPALAWHSDAKNNLEFPLKSEGTHVVVMQTTSSFREMEAAEFNAYLKDNGLDEAYSQRETTNSLSSNGKEFYSYCAKLIVQAGNKIDDGYNVSAGLPVEIIPVQNPFTTKVGDMVRFKILFNGKPWFSAKVKVWNRYNNRTTIQNVYSQQDGMIEARISTPGPWMVSVVKMIPSKDRRAHWQSYCGSLVFGIK